MAWPVAAGKPEAKGNAKELCTEQAAQKPGDHMWNRGDCWTLQPEQVCVGQDLWGSNQVRAESWCRGAAMRHTPPTDHDLETCKLLFGLTRRLD